MKRVALDTNAYSALMVGDQEILGVLESASQVLISPVCIGELLAGFKLGTKEKTNRALLSRFLTQPTVHITPITADTSEWFASIFSKLQRNGTPIPLNDVWIAASAQENGAVILTFDKHFSLIAGIRMWKEV